MTTPLSERLRAIRRMHQSALSTNSRDVSDWSDDACLAIELLEGLEPELDTLTAELAQARERIAELEAKPAVSPTLETAAWLYQHKTEPGKAACVCRPIDMTLEGSNDYHEIPLTPLHAAQACIANLEAENFTLAAGQCVEATADEGGRPYCKRIAALEAERDALKTALNKIAERTGSDDPCKALVQIARDALRGNGS